jgi:hypothetical protein
MASARPPTLLEETDEGPFRICACAIGAEDGGYVAGAVVLQVRGVPSPIEVFSDDQLSAGHTWEEPERALHFAMTTARAILQERQRMASGSTDG